MIKCKEDLYDTKITSANQTLVTAYLKKCQEFGIEWLSGVPALSQETLYNTFGVCNELRCLHVDPESHFRELTLADFEEEVTPETTTPKQYRYEKLEYESVFDLKEHLEEGNLFYGQSFIQVPHEWKLLNIIVEDKYNLYLRTEIKWQDEVGELLCSNEMEDLLCHEPDRFLEAARITLKATGELE